MAGFLVSRMRSGLLCRRRRASASSSSLVLLEVLHQRGAVRAPLFGLAQAVEFQPHLGQAQVAPQRARHQDHLGIDIRPGKAQRLDADLVELPVAAALRLLVPEHRADVEQPLAAVVEQRMLD